MAAVQVIKKKPNAKGYKGEVSVPVCPTNNQVCARGVFSGLYFATLTLRCWASKHGCACTVGICFVLSSSSWGRL